MLGPMSILMAKTKVNWTRDIYVKYQSSSTHCSKGITKVKVSNRIIFDRGDVIKKHKTIDLWATLHT